MTTRALRIDAITYYRNYKLLRANLELIRDVIDIRLFLWADEADDITPYEVMTERPAPSDRWDGYCIGDSWHYDTSPLLCSPERFAEIDTKRNPNTFMLRLN